MSQDIAYWVGFSKVSGVGPQRMKKLLDYFGDIKAAWHANLGELAAIGLDKRAITNLAKARNELDLEAELTQIEKLNVSLLTWEDPAYPSPLLNIPDPPFLLYVRGNLIPTDEWALAVVGTRSASVYGKEATRMLVNGLASSGVTVVSGLALGIDTEAHTAALEVSGRTIAVLGCGVDVLYPYRNKKLGEKIIENGAIISEFPPGTKPDSRNFPRRNRIISGLSLGVLLVEGAEQSGARITVDYALEQGREVFAVPGNIFSKASKGPNKLIQQGAKLVTNIGDILEELNLTMAAQYTEAKAVIPDTPQEAALLKHLSAYPVHIDDLGEQTGIASADLASALTMMELKGQVRQVGGMNYIIARESGIKYVVD